MRCCAGSSRESRTRGCTIQAVIPADSRSQGLAIAHLARRHHRRTLRDQRGRRDLGRRFLDAEARARPRGRHADHPRAARSRPASPSRRSSSTRPSRSSASASTRRASPRPRSTPRARTSSSASPASSTTRRATRIESSAKLELRAVLLADAATNQSIDPSARPRAHRARRGARVDTDGRADRRQRPGVDHARRCRTSSTTSTARRSTRPRRTLPPPTSRSSPATSAAPRSTCSARSRRAARTSSTRPTAW